MIEGFATRDGTRIFGDGNRVQRLLDVEAALANAQADAGLIPPAAAAAITAAAHVARFDPAAVLAGGWEVGTPIIPLTDRLRDLVGEDHAAFVHLGATTQDIIDTATVLQIREAIEVVDENWRRLGAVLADLAHRHRSTPMLGRTFLQAAGTTSFGRVAAGWLASVAADLHRSAAVRADMPVQLGGPIGIPDALGDRAAAVTEGLADRLGLAVPALPWHTDRRPIRSVAALVSDVAATTRRLATDTLLLAQTGVEEVTVRAGRSSAIPGKRNPIDAIRAGAAAQVAATQAAGLLMLGPYERERAGGAWHAEWALVPLALHATLAGAEAIERSMATLEPDQDRMAANLTAAGQAPGVPAAADEIIDRALAAYRAAV